MFKCSGPSVQNNGLNFYVKLKHRGYSHSHEYPMFVGCGAASGYESSQCKHNIWRYIGHIFLDRGTWKNCCEIAKICDAYTRSQWNFLIVLWPSNLHCIRSSRLRFPKILTKLASSYAICMQVFDPSLWIHTWHYLYAQTHVYTYDRMLVVSYY